MDVLNGRLYVEQNLWNVYVFEDGKITSTYSTDQVAAGELEWVDKDDEIFDVPVGSVEPHWITELYEKVEAL